MQWKNIKSFSVDKVTSTFSTILVASCHVPMKMDILLPNLLLFVLLSYCKGEGEIEIRKCCPEGQVFKTAFQCGQNNVKG